MTKRDIQDRLVVPDSLKVQLKEFRDRVWFTKTGEALVFAVFAITVGYLTVYTIDRNVDTPPSIRILLFLAAISFWLMVPLAVYRWVWQQRKFEQLARLLRRRDPDVGDQLLSVLELAENESEQARSRTLCAAAIAQVAESASQRDLRTSAPATWLRPGAIALGTSFIAALILAMFFPAAAGNAWRRFLAPWSETPRYTFTKVQPLPAQWIMAHGEPATLKIQLDEQTQWHPSSAALDIPGQETLYASLSDGAYLFDVPPQISLAKAQVSVGDFYRSIDLRPEMRPEIVEATATIRLPEYLQRQEEYELDVRSGELIAVDGSTAALRFTASRELSEASVGAFPIDTDGASFIPEPVQLNGSGTTLSIAWVDTLGLGGRNGFELEIKPTADELPSVVSQDLPRQAVILDTEQLNFQALAADDFGIKRIGLSWQSLDDRLVEPASGERLIAAGGSDRTSMQVPATFSAYSLGITPQPIEVRLWVEDYLPGRQRSYSPPHTFFVLTAEQHAVWVTDQLSKWHRASLDVRDKELQLHASNKRLREQANDGSAENLREELKRQASLENANARRLAALSSTGESLLRQAARNPEIGATQLDSWAEMLQILNDIGSNRMPSVAQLLAKASAQPKASKGGPTQPSAPQAGSNRNTKAVQSKEPNGEELASGDLKMPTIADNESSSYQPDGQEDKEDADQKEKQESGGSRLSLPTTTLAGPPPKSDPNQQPGEDEATEEEEEPFSLALYEQQKLLAEFEKISDELNALLANLEGSTLVKRLKAASREQDQIAQKIGGRLGNVFGRATRLPDEDLQVLRDLGSLEQASSSTISYIMDDLQSYYERRRMQQFKLVLDEMKESDVLVALQDLGDEIPIEHGISIAQAEYWSDSLDRWAEDLVESGSSDQQKSKGAGGTDALPPALILEVLKILEAEVNLREETRVAEQAKAARSQAEHAAEALRLSNLQSELRQRTDAVVETLLGMPSGAQRFKKDVDLLSNVSVVMADAQSIMAKNETGQPAIAAETEAIELLLQSKRVNPKAAGGGGTSPGGGGKGTTQDSALALLGSGLNQNERREYREVSQSTGETGSALPEEYRGGLDRYFEEIERSVLQ